MRRAGLAAVGVSVLLAACGGGSDDSGGAAETEAAAAPATTVAETTTSTTSTSTTSTTTTTSTLAPTTTLSPEQLSIAAAEQALVKAFEAQTAALADPSDQELREELLNYWAESALPTVTAQLDEFETNSKVLVLNDDPEAFLEVLPGSELVAPSRIVVPFCRLNSNTIVVHLEGIDAVLNDIVTTERWIAAVVADNGVWKVAGADLISEADGEVDCDALP